MIYMHQETCRRKFIAAKSIMVKKKQTLETTKCSSIEKQTVILVMKVKAAQSCRLFASPWIIQSMGFSRPEYWSG